MPEWRESPTVCCQMCLNHTSISLKTRCSSICIFSFMSSPPSYVLPILIHCLLLMLLIVFPPPTVSPHATPCFSLSDSVEVSLILDSLCKGVLAHLLFLAPITLVYTCWFFFLSAFPPPSGYHLSLI